MNINIYRLQVVKEKAVKYELEDSITSPRVMAEILNKAFGLSELAEESLIVIALNTQNKIAGMFEISKGNLNSAMVSTASIAKAILLTNSQKFILAHNHPSGKIEPSESDKNLTRKVKQAMELLSIEMIDHIIVGGDEFYSFATHRELE